MTPSYGRNKKCHSTNLQMPKSMYIPQEIVSNIVFQLPAKSIARWRCVSKQWSSMLSTPEFIKAHLSKHQNQSLLIISTTGSLYSLNFNNAHQVFEEITEPAEKLSFGDHPDTWVAILASYDGLVLVEDEQDQRFLINPTTREIVKVADAPFAPFLGIYNIYGLGYDSVSDDYKIVAISYFSSIADLYDELTPEAFDIEGSVYVYSVRNGTWKRVENSPYFHHNADNASGVFVDGSIFWVAGSGYDESPLIMAFDLSKEHIWELTSLKSYGNLFSYCYRLVLLGECLCMPISTHYTGFYESGFWLQKEYGDEECWTKFSFTDVKKSEFRPLCLLRDGQVVLIKDEERPGEQLVVYDMKTETFKEIVVHNIPEGFFCARGVERGIGRGMPTCVSTFVESLISPLRGHDVGGG